MNTSQLFKLNQSDLVKGLVTAVLTAAFAGLYQVVNTPGFDFFSIDWNLMLHTLVNAGAAGLLGYLAKNFLSDGNGHVLGKIG